MNSIEITTSQQERLAILICILLTGHLLSSCTVMNSQEQSELISTQRSAPSRPIDTPILTFDITTSVIVPLKTESGIVATTTPDPNELQKIFSDDFMCEDPCIMGIIPNVSTIQDVLEQTSRLNLEMYPDPTIIKTDSYSISYDFFLHSPGNYLSFSLLILPEGSLVKGLDFAFQTGITNIFERKEWVNFTPETIIKEFGIPDAIQIYIEPSTVYDVEGGTYSMYFFYTEKQVTVLYSSANRIVPEDGKYILCPGKDIFYWHRMWMGTATEGVPPLRMEYELDNNSSISKAAFSNSLLDSPENFCFDYSDAQN